MAESFSVEAILSATDKNMTSTMKKALGACESFGDRVKSIVAGVGVTKVIGATMNVLSSSFDGAINRFDTMQSYPKVMKSLGFEVEQSQKSVAKLNQSVQGLPTSLADVVTTSKSLAAVTGNIDKATDTTIALNHAFLASGSSSEDASRGLQQYSQMLAKGTVDMQSWRTLQETMAPALTKVAKKLGIASGNANELYDALQNGTITFDQFNDAMIECDTETGGFAETALEASKGVKTSMTNIKSAVQNLEQGFMSAMNNMLKSKAMGGLVDNLEKIKSKIYDFRNSIMETKDDGLTWDFKPGVMENVSKAMDWLADRANNAKNMIKQFYDGFMKTDAVQNAITMFDKIKDAIGNVMDKLQDSKVFEQLGQDIGNIIAKVEDVTSKIADFVANLKTEDVKKFASAVKLLAGAFVGVKVGSKLTSTIKGVVGSAQSGYSKLKSIMDKIKGVGGTEGAPTSSPSSSGVSDIGNASIQTAQKTSKAAQIINSAFEGISNVISSVCEGAKGIITSLGDAISNVFEGLGNGIKSALEGVGTVIESFGTAISTVAQGIGQGLATAFTGLGTAIAMVPPTTWLALAAAILATGAAMALVGSQGEGLQMVLEGVANVVSAFGPVIKDVFEGISNVIQSFGETVSGILNSVSGVIKSIGQSALNAGKGFKQLANGIKIITSLNLIDMGASLGAVAVGIGAIATASSGMGDIGAQMMALATALTMIVSTQAGIESLSATIPSLSDALSSLSGISEPLTVASGAMTAFAGAIAPVASSVMATATSIAVLVTVASTISSAFTSASSASVTSINAIVTAMTNAEAKATTSGTAMGTNFTKGLGSGLKTGVSVAKSSCQSIISAFNSCQSRAEYCGRMIGQGLVNGLRASEGSVRAAAASLAAAADAAIQAKAKIGSPSKVTKKDGMWIGKGFVLGLESMYSDVKRASEDLLYLPMLDAPKMAFGGIVSDMNPDYEYTNNAQLTIETPLYINDREFARATYRANQNEFDRHSKFNERLRGNK
ncbi:tape measure protein [Holdemanella biformis]|uniref:tape measure protein n=1 Tax=Holdemanella biformis TaxID=1735 RepID=UPI0022DFE79A|nr:tape measure protein [Holdemanella biformis]